MSRGFSKSVSMLLAALLVGSSQVPAQSEPRHKTLVVSGHSGAATVIQMNGRAYVDVEMLAQAVSGSLMFRDSQIILSLPNTPASAPAASPDARQPAEPRFSREFTSAAIESLGTMREWASALAAMIKNGYPVGNTMADYGARAGQSFRLASAAASNATDQRGMQLLTNEFNNVQQWSDNLVKARNSMGAANFALSEDALLNDPLSQKILHCWQFLGPMLASGTFQDDSTCH